MTPDLHVAQARVITVDGPAPHLILALADGADRCGLAALPSSPATRDALLAALIDTNDDPIPDVAGAIANALFDLRSRQLGVPQHVMLGGALRGAVPLVAAVMLDDGSAAAFDRAVHLVDALHARTVSLHVPNTDEALVATAVDALYRRYGSKLAVRICLRAGSTAARVQKLAQVLRELTIECCYIAPDMGALDLGLTPVGLLATGTRADPLRDLAPCAVINSVLTDARTAGGPAAFHRIAAVAQVFQLEVATAAPTGSAIDLFANAHSAMSAFTAHGGVELFAVPDFALFGPAASCLREGAVVLPDAPGVGVGLDAVLLARSGHTVERVALPRQPRSPIFP